MWFGLHSLFFLTSVDFYHFNSVNTLPQQQYFFNSSALLNYQNIYTMAQLSLKVYYEPDNPDFKNISLDDTTVRAYMYSNENESEYLIAFKGTSVLSDGSDSNTKKNDKFNDNLFFSCCYYKETYIKCPIDTRKNHGFTCNTNCYTKSLEFENNYYIIAEKIYKYISSITKPDSKIYFTGHSLGSAMAIIVGARYNIPVITFSTPNIKHYLEMSGIKYNKRSEDNIYNFGSNSDPIFMGRCNGITSICYNFGYIMNTKCTYGYRCTYDSKTKLRLSESIYTHKLQYQIDNIIPYWENDFPVCIKENCTDCNNWNYN